jgi:hypothetical protein
MTINSLAALTDAARYTSEMRKSSPASTSLGGSYWKQASLSSIPLPGQTPPTAVAGGTFYDRNVEGALFTPGGPQRLAGLRVSADTTSEYIVMLVDRLVACSGLALNTLTPQAVTLPPLPRHTDGKGVWAALELYTAANTVASSHAITYTNQDGTPGRVSATLVDPFGATAGSTAGDLGITLFRPICIVSVGPAATTDSPSRLKPRDWLDLALAEVDDACLTPMILATAASAAAVVTKMKLDLLAG